MLKYFRGSWQPTIVKHTKCILYTNIHAFNFRGLPSPRKYFNNEHFPKYSISFNLLMALLQPLLVFFFQVEFCFFAVLFCRRLFSGLKVDALDSGHYIVDNQQY